MYLDAEVEKLATQIWNHAQVVAVQHKNMWPVQNASRQEYETLTIGITKKKQGSSKEEEISDDPQNSQEPSTMTATYIL